LVEAAINRYIPASWPAEHEARLAPHRQAARDAFAALIAVRSMTQAISISSEGPSPPLPNPALTLPLLPAVVSARRCRCRCR
jgi:hypothetical protein